MKYIIIGLGNYGTELAEKLSLLNHEVIGVDVNAHRVDFIKDRIATAFIFNAADENSLAVLPLREVDIVIVAIGENLGASIRIVALLKKNKVRHIFARAIDEVHKAVLEAFGLDRILTPEKDAADNLVRLLDFGTDVEAFQVDTEHYVIKFKVPESLDGYSLEELQWGERFNVRVISVKRGVVTRNMLDIPVEKGSVEDDLPEGYLLQTYDEIVCFGRYRDFSYLFKSFKIKR